MNHHDTRQRIIFVLPGLTTGGAERVLITLMNHFDRQAGISRVHNGTLEKAPERNECRYTQDDCYT